MFNKILSFFSRKKTIVLNGADAITTFNMGSVYAFKVIVEYLKNDNFDKNYVIETLEKTIKLFENNNKGKIN